MPVDGIEPVVLVDVPMGFQDMGVGVKGRRERHADECCSIRNIEYRVGRIKRKQTQ